MLVNGRYLILGNWKMHGTIKESVRLAGEVATASATVNTSVSVGIAPAYVHLAAVENTIKNSTVLLGAQTCAAETVGAFTGDISATMLADCGCKFVIVGHSERRQLHNETSEQVCDMATAALQENLHVVVCVGETLEQREEGNFLDVITLQLEASLPDRYNRDCLTVAYEPVWAIGSGKTASSEDIHQVHTHIQEFLRASSQFSDSDKKIPRVLYGGSVKANNALDIMALPVVDGVLVGGASLDANAFKAIIEAAEISAQKR
ncbi:MAG: triose-phosphate isomerase [Alphaproteobacteria bacterium]|nr:triose-phosphate isomerase [Alphaproteobacteria bacterium]